MAGAPPVTAHHPAERVLSVAVYHRTNLTVRQLAPLFGVTVLIIVDTETRLVMAAARTVPGTTADAKAWRDSGPAEHCGGAAVLGDGVCIDSGLTGQRLCLACAAAVLRYLAVDWPPPVPDLVTCRGSRPASRDPDRGGLPPTQPPATNETPATGWAFPALAAALCRYRRYVRLTTWDTV